MTAITTVITGASDGIGAAAAKMLAHPGNKLVIVGRSPEKTEAVAKELDADFYLADFADLAQVRNLAATLVDQYPRIDVLANNAGGIMGHRELTVDGHEKTFQVNHLAPFLLTTLLMDRLLESHARVINTSSAANRMLAKLDIDDLDAARKYSTNRAYGNAKLANILFTRELQRRYGDKGLTAVAFHPGAVGSNFSAGSTTWMRLGYTKLTKPLLLSPEKGADTLVWLATSTPGDDWVPGEYYAKRKIARVSPQADDPLLALQLWDRSMAMVAAKKSRGRSE